jgi:two-component system capsular synthesis response regulator RcsB
MLAPHLPAPRGQALASSQGEAEHPHSERIIVNIRVILADDHPFVLLGIRLAIEGRSGIAVVGEAASPSALIELLRSTPCDVLVTDLAMPDPGTTAGDGLHLVRRIRRDWPALPVVVLTSLSNGSILRSIVVDEAVSVLNKAESMDDVVSAILLAARGDVHIGRPVAEALDEAGSGAVVAARLSRRETEVVQMFATGLSIREIARQLDRDVRTVSRQKRDAMMKLGVHNDPGLLAFAYAHGLI